MNCAQPRIGITVLGATGSIGLNTLDVIARHAEQYSVVALTANTRCRRHVRTLCRKHRPRYAVMADADAAERLERRLRDEALATRCCRATKV